MTDIAEHVVPSNGVPGCDAIHHLSLTVTDVDASKAWYERVLGLEHVMTEEHTGGYAVVMNRPGTGVFIGLTHHEATVPESFAETRTGLDHVALHVSARSDLDRWVAHLDAQGVPHSGVSEVNDPFPYALVVFRDPANIQLEVLWT